MIQLFTQYKQKIMQPVLLDEITWETSRKGSPGELTFTVLGDYYLTLAHGDAVWLMDDKDKLFFGSIYTVSHGGDSKIKVTAYDQLRQLKNTDVFIYKNKRADQVIRMVADDMGLKCGPLTNTGYNIPTYVGDGKTYFDIVQDALDSTVMANGNLYVLYDDYGKLALRNVSDMTVPFLIDADTCGGYDFQSSIDNKSYNKIKLVYNDSNSGKRRIFSVQDSNHMAEWGTLQKYESINSTAHAQQKANIYLSLYNHVERTVTLKDVFGDNRIRAGCTVFVRVNMGEVQQNGWLVVNQCTHKWKGGAHTMDLTLEGGVFDAGQ